MVASWETAEEIAALNALALTQNNKEKSREAELSIQARAKGEEEPSDGRLLYIMARAGETVPGWWSVARDERLQSFWKGIDHFSGAVYSIAAKLESVPFRIEPRDPTVQRHWKQAQEYEIRLVEKSEYDQGWGQFFAKWLLDFWTSDNGAFAEVIGAGKVDGPIVGNPVGLANLDSRRCIRTSNPEYPVVYQDTDSKKYKLHRTRVIFASQLPSADAKMNGVGFCWLSRCISVAQGLSDVMQYKQEKLGSRPLRAILYGSGVDTSIVTEAVTIANESADNKGFSKYSALPVIATKSSVNPLTLDILDLATLPDGFEYSDDVTLGMYTIALAGGFPPRWLWPATAVGATKADALLQHTAMSVSGASQALSTIQRLLAGTDKGKRHMAGKFLPPQLKMVFDFQDDEQDRLQAEIKDKRSQTNQRDLESGVVTIQVARQRMLADGDITESQLEDMELEDGRTPDGKDARDVLYSDGPYVSGIDPDNPDINLVKLRLREVKRIAAVATNPRERREARIAVSALETLLQPETVNVADEDQGQENEAEQDEVDEEKQRNEEPFSQAVGKAFDEFEEEALDSIVEEQEEPDYQVLFLALLAIVKPFLVSALTNRVSELVDEWNVTVDPAEIATYAMEWARTYSFDLISGITDTTKNLVSAALQQYLDTPGMTRGELAALLEPAFGQARAQVISATEITRARSQGVFTYSDILRALGLEVVEYWETALDERVCQYCGPLHDTTKDIWSADHPDGPPAHPSCRCGIRLEVIRRV